MSARSCSFLKPGNAMLVPLMYFLGFSCERRSGGDQSVTARLQHGSDKTTLRFGSEAAHEVGEQRVVAPRDARLLVGLSVLEPRDLARLAAHHAEEVRALLIGTALVAGVAGRALGLEQLGTIFRFPGGRHESVSARRAPRSSDKAQLGQLLASARSRACSAQSRRAGEGNQAACGDDGGQLVIKG